MKQHLLFFSLALATTAAQAQITITDSDFGSAGDNVMIITATPANTISVGGAGANQTWNINLPIDGINTLTFKNVAATNSGAHFPNANLAIERLTDTLFFEKTASAFIFDGISGDWLGLGYGLRANFEPDAAQMVFPSTYLDSYLDTAKFDTIVDCTGFGAPCDSARVRRESYYSSTIDAHGTLNTPSGTYTTIRQYLKENTRDRVWVKLPIIGWQSQPYMDSSSVTHNYRWLANGEKWPVLSVVASAQNGNIVSAEYLVGENVLGTVVYANAVSCFEACDGSAAVVALGGIPPYSYAWPASAGNQVLPIAAGLCAGTYTVTITDSNASTVTVDVTITEPEGLSIAGSVQNITDSVGNGKIDITVGGGTPPYTYAWTGPMGYTSTNADITALVDSGTYEVVVTDSNGCEISFVFVLGSTVGVVETPAASLLIYPNPVPIGIQLTILSPTPVEAVRVYDLLGNCVSEKTTTAKSLTMDVSKFSRGTYLVEVIGRDVSVFSKVTVGE